MTNVPSLARLMSFGPPMPVHMAEELAVGREDLDALVRAVGDVEFAVMIERDAVGQVELALGFARRAP